MVQIGGGGPGGTTEAATGSGVPAAQVVVEHYDVLGYRAAVGVSAGEARAAVRTILRGFGPVAPAPGPDLPGYELAPTPAGWQVRAGGEVVHAGADFLVALATLEWHIVTAALMHRDDLFHLHAAGLCLPTRRAGLLLAGDSGNGKTTLALGLMLRGFSPFGDDVAVLDPQSLELHPLRRAFHTDQQTWEIVGSLVAGPLRGDDDAPPGYFIPPQWAERPVPVRWVLFPDYWPGRTPQLVRLAPAEAAAALLAHTTSLARTPRLALPTVTHLIERAACYRFLGGDLPASVAAIERLVASDPGETASPGWLG
jgi:hypothetical protein